MALTLGLGNVALKTNDLIGLETNPILNQKIIPYPCLDLEYDTKETTSSAQVYRAGTQTDEETYRGKTENSLKLKTQISNWAMTGLGFNEIQKVLSSFTVPAARRVKVPANGIILDSTILAGAIVFAATEQFGAWGQPGPIAMSSLTVAAGSVTLPIMFAGSTVTLLFNRVMTSAKAYGGPGSTVKYGEFELIAYVYDNIPDGKDGDTLIYLPSITRKNSDTKISFTGKLIEYETEWVPAIPPGWSKPHAYIDGHSIVWA